MSMRRFGWTLVIVTWLASLTCAGLSALTYGYLQTPAGKERQAIAAMPSSMLSTPVGPRIIEERRWLAETKAAIDTGFYGALGAAAVGMVCAVMMAATARPVTAESQ